MRKCTSSSPLNLNTLQECSVTPMVFHIGIILISKYFYSRIEVIVVVF